MPAEIKEKDGVIVDEKTVQQLSGLQSVEPQLSIRETDEFVDEITQRVGCNLTFTDKVKKPANQSCAKVR